MDSKKYLILYYSVYTMDNNLTPEQIKEIAMSEARKQMYWTWEQTSNDKNAENSSVLDNILKVIWILFWIFVIGIIITFWILIAMDS